MTRRGRRPGRDRERGSASIWVISCAALLLVIALVIALRTSAVLARHRAAAAADAAALAAAGQIGLGSDPCGNARVIAAANGAVLRDCRLELDPNARSGRVRVTVTIAVGLPIVGRSAAQASARAQRDPG